MARFVTALKTEKVRESEGLGRAHWRLVENLVYESDLVGWVFVPAGTETDFASVPRMPLAYWLTGDTAHASAVVHDWLCRTEFAQGRMSWRLAADVFREAMQVEGVPGWRRWLMYWAVRAAAPA